MSEALVPVPAVPKLSKTIILRPLKAVSNLQERYSEATADVVFVGRERLPAHRAVLSIASAVFFRMFEGDWKETRERSIPAPTEYNWEAFKAAITLLYGAEVQVDESSILDVYRVAHCYDLGYVTVVLAHAVSQWGAGMRNTVVELCVLAGQLETVEAQEHEMIEAAVTYIAKHLAQIKAKPADLNTLPYQAMLQLVQSEDISICEGDVFLLLRQWIDAQVDITVRQAKHLYLHIRYGLIPYKFLSLGINQENLDMTLENHQKLSMDRLKKNLKQITPRLCQKEVLQAYPLIADLLVSRKGNKWEFLNVPNQNVFALGVLFSGRQELSFQLKVSASVQEQLHIELSSCCEKIGARNATAQIDLGENFSLNRTVQKESEESNLPRRMGMSVSYSHFAITLKSTGVFMLSESHDCKVGVWALPSDERAHVCRNVKLPFKGPFPWILKIGVPVKHCSLTVSHCSVTIVGL